MRFEILVGRPEGKKQLGRPRHRWDGKIKLDFKDLGCEDVNWIHLVQDMVQWQAFLNTVINFSVQSKAGNFLTAEQLLTFQKGICF
jgi:hypothetical protein